jgi:hypothetical protein
VKTKNGQPEVCAVREEKRKLIPADHATIELLFGPQQWCALF